MLQHFTNTTLANYIDGQLVPPANGAYLPLSNPALGTVYAQAPASDATDAQHAVAAAQAAAPHWAALSATQRSEYLLRIADLIDRYANELALAECEDNGKPLRLAQTVDIPRAAANFRFFATAPLHFSTEAHANETVSIQYTLRQPLGVVACISPWNLPLYLFTWKIAPALAAGNTVVAKPSEITPRTAFLLSEIAQQAQLPHGVLNIVHGYGHEIGTALVSHPAVKAVSFTGGTQTGAAIARIAAPLFKKLSLELGGKNPTIIFADADFEQAVATAVRSSFSNQGQICLCGSRLLIERPLYERFKTAFLASVAALQPADPLLPSTRIGAVVSEAHLQKIMQYIQLAQDEGGTLLAGGQRAQLTGRCQHGWFVQPTVLEGLPNECRTNQEEIFGPLVTLQAFDTDEQALQMANNTPYGLAANIWTQQLNRAHRFAEQLQFGIVWVNCWMERDLRTPFGGSKNSGVGREGGWEALRFFTEPKNVCIKYK